MYTRLLGGEMCVLLRPPDRPEMGLHGFRKPLLYPSELRGHGAALCCIASVCASQLWHFLSCTREYWLRSWLRSRITDQSDSAPNSESLRTPLGTPHRGRAVYARCHFRRRTA